MPTVVNILDHLGRLQVGSDQRCIYIRVELRKQIATGLVQLPDHSLGRAAEVSYCGPLTQKLRITANTEVRSRPFSGEFLQGRNNDVVHRARQNRAPDDNGVAPYLVLDCFANLFTYPANVTKIQVSIWLAGRSYANER